MASRIADILFRAKLIDDLQMRSAGAHQAQWGGRLPTIVVEKRFAAEDKVTEAISTAMKLPKVDLETVEIDPAAVAKLDADYCKVNGVFPCALKDNGKTLWLAMVDPTALPIVDEVSAKARARVMLVVASERQIIAAVKRAYYADPQGSSNELGYGGIAPIEAEVGSEEDGKIVDMSGHTLIKNIKDIAAQAEAARAAKPPPPAPPVGPTEPGPVTGASAMLDDLFGGPEDAGLVWTEEDLARLRTIQDQQEKGARILRAVLDLCVGKGLFRPDEYRVRLKKLI